MPFGHLLLAMSTPIAHLGCAGMVKTNFNWPKFAQLAIGIRQHDVDRLNLVEGSTIICVRAPLVLAAEDWQLVSKGHRLELRDSSTQRSPERVGQLDKIGDSFRFRMIVGELTAAERTSVASLLDHFRRMSAKEGATGNEQSGTLSLDGRGQGEGDAVAAEAEMGEMSCVYNDTGRELYIGAAGREHD